MSPLGLIRTMLGVAALLLMAAIGFNYLVDSYEVFGTGVLPGHGDVNERFTKIEVLKRNPKFDTILLGSSRISVLDPREFDKAIPGATTFNFTVAQANQWDAEQLVHWVVDHQSGVKRIFVQIDWPETYGGDRPDYALLTTMHPDITGTTKWDFYWSYLSQFNFGAIEQKIANSMGGDNIAIYDAERGNWSRPIKDQKIDANCQTYVSQGTFAPTAVNNDGGIVQQNLEAIKRYIAYSKSKNVDVVLWLTPHNAHYLDRIDFDKYQQFVARLVEIAPIYDFMLYSPVTSDDCNYYEWSHYRPKIGAYIAHIVGTAQRASADASFLYIDRQSLSQQLEYLRQNFSAGRSRSKSQ